MNPGDRSGQDMFTALIPFKGYRMSFKIGSWHFTRAILAILAVLPAWADLPDGITLKPYLTPATTDFITPISFHEIPGKPGAFVVVQKNGKLIYYEPKTGRTLIWSAVPVCDRTEEGLYTIAFHPDFVKNGRYYAFYSPVGNFDAPPTNYGHPGKFVETLAEYLADAKREKDSGTPPRIIREFCCKDGPGHNGMYAVFGHDRKLYLSIGDGNSDGRETQTRQTLLGTVLRIDVDKPDPGRMYGIPPDNPFVNDPNPKVIKEIWAYGFRNSFKLAIDPLDGNLWVGNVGGWHEDHVSRIGKGDNFGWPITEGTVCFDAAKYSTYKPPLPNCNRIGITPPTIPVPHALPRGNGNSNCVIGPVIYRGNPESAFYGAVFFADYTSYQLFAARLDADGNLAEKKEYAKTRSRLIHLMEASDGRILALGYGGRQFFYLDHPELLLGPSVGIKASRSVPAITRRRSAVRYDVAGKRIGPNILPTTGFDESARSLHSGSLPFPGMDSCLPRPSNPLPPGRR